MKAGRFTLTSPYLWLALYILVMVASTIVSIDPKKSVIVLAATSLCIAGGVIVAQLTRDNDLPHIQKLLNIITVVVCLFGVYQFLGDSFDLSPSLTGVQPNYVKEVFGFPRIQSTLQEPLFFANYLLLPLLLLAATLYARQRRNCWLFVALGLFSLTMALTLSRGGLVASLLGLGLIGLLLWRLASWQSKAVVAATIVLGGLCAMAAIFLATSTTSGTSKGQGAVKRYAKQSTTLEATTTSSDSDRVTNKYLAKQAFRERPILGYGAGAFGAYARQERPETYRPPGNSNPTVNNEYYEVLAETGLAGAIALIGFIGSLALRLFSSWRSQLNPYKRTWLVALTATGAAYALQYYAFSTLYIPYIWVTFGLLLAISTPRKNNATTQVHL
jgi:O-antigen ligase